MVCSKILLCNAAAKIIRNALCHHQGGINNESPGSNTTLYIFNLLCSVSHIKIQFPFLSLYLRNNSSIGSQGLPNPYPLSHNYLKIK